MNRLKAKEAIGGFVERNRQVPCDFLKAKGTFEAEVWRPKKSGNFYLVERVLGKNQITTAGKNHALDVVFGNSSPVSQVATWYVGLINNTPTPTLLVGDTLASHSGWAETTAYTGNRKAWNDANASSGAKASSSASAFTMNATVSVYGIFICSVDTGTSGTLWSEGAFDAVIPLVSSDVLNVTYSLAY